MSHLSVWLSQSKHLGLLILVALVSSACGGWPLAATEPTPTQPAIAINFEVTVISLATATPTATATPSPTATATATSASVLLTLTPTLTPIAIPSPTPVPIAPVNNAPTETPTATPAGPPTLVAISPVQGTISLLAPENNAPLASNIDQLEVKWQWQGDRGVQSCMPVSGYGFEVRIWPAIDGFGPLGAMDAALNQRDGNFACNAETGVYTYLVTFLKSKPGVKPVGAGKFLWDVAFVQLSPYQPVLTTQPRLFEITFDYNGSLDPFGAPLRCSDFNSWVEAQAVFIAAGGPAKDRHNLDPDGNGFACEDLKK